MKIHWTEPYLYYPTGLAGGGITIYPLHDSDHGSKDREEYSAFIKAAAPAIKELAGKKRTLLTRVEDALAAAAPKVQEVITAMAVNHAGEPTILQIPVSPDETPGVSISRSYPLAGGAELYHKQSAPAGPNLPNAVDAILVIAEAVLGGTQLEVIYDKDDGTGPKRRNLLPKRLFMLPEGGQIGMVAGRPALKADDLDKADLDKSWRLDRISLPNIVMVKCPHCGVYCRGQTFGETTRYFWHRSRYFEDRACSGVGTLLTAEVAKGLLEKFETDPDDGIPF